VSEEDANIHNIFLFSCICYLLNIFFTFILTLTSVHSAIPDVAMVIITTMVAKIYFPESLERGAAVPQARNFNYRMAAENDDYYASDNDDVEESSGNKSDGDNDDENEVLASDEDDDAEGLELGTEGGESNDLLSEMRPVSGARHGRPGVTYDSSRILEFDQTDMSKMQVIKRLVICIVMLNVTFVTWGVLQVSLC
jgi:hypothetical protein